MSREMHRILTAGLFPCNSKGNVFTTVQAAIDDLAGDGWVYVPAGQWAEALTITNDDVELFGGSWDSQINGGATGHAISITGDRVIVKDLRVLTTGGTGNAFNGISVSGGYTTRIIRVWVQDSDQMGIQITGASEYSTVTDCHIQDTDNIGIDWSANYCIISNNFLLNIGSWGINAGGAGDFSVIVGNTIQSSGNDGIAINAAAEQCVIVGNQINGWTNEAIDDDSATSVVYGNNGGGAVMTSLGVSFATVDAACDAVTVGGWVEVPAGTWSESVSVSSSDLLLRGQGPDSIIDGATTGHAVYITGARVTVRDLQVKTTPGQANFYDGVNISGSYATIDNVYVSQSDDDGIEVAVGGVGSHIINCRIDTTDDGGIVTSARITILNNRIYNAGTYGVQIAATGDETLVSGNLIDTTASDGIFIGVNGDACIVIGNTIISWTGEPIDNDAADCLVVNNNAGGSVMNSLGCSHLTIQGAIDHVEAFGGGGWIEVPVGTWTEGLTIADDDITLRGLGRGSLIAPSTGTGISVSGDYDNIVIRDLAVDTKVDTAGTAIVFDNGVSYGLIENVTIVDSDDVGIRVSGTACSYIRIINCRILGADAQGILVDFDGGHTGQYNTIRDCYIAGCGDNGIGFGATGAGHTYTVISGNQITGGSVRGMLLQEMQWSTISDNICFSNSWSGISLSGCANNSVVGNACRGNGRHGISLVNADQNSIMSNIIYGNDSGDSQTYDGINLDVNSTDCVVSNNICYGNSVQRYGIWADGARTLVSNNYCALHDYSGIYIDGGQSQIVDNYCYDNGQDAAGTYHEILVDPNADRSIVSNNFCNSPGDSSEDCINLANGTHTVQVTNNFCYNGMGSGIQLVANNDNCLITGNTLTANDDYGVLISAASCNDNIVKNNKFISNGTAPVSDSGTDTGFHGIPFFVANNDQQLGQVPGKTLTNTQTAYIPVHAPDDMQQIMGFHIHVIAQATQAAANWDLDSDYAATGEAYTTHNEQDAASTYNVTDTEWFELDAFDKGILASFEGGDSGGVSLTVSTAGHNVCVVFGHLSYV